MILHCTVLCVFIVVLLYMCVSDVLFMSIHLFIYLFYIFFLPFDVYV